MAPPAGERRLHVAVPVGHVQASHGTGAGVEVLVGAPHAEVDARVVKGVGHCADGMGEVDAEDDVVLASRPAQATEVEPLAAPVEHGRQERQPDGRVGHRLGDVGLLDRPAVGGLDDAEVRRRIAAQAAQLGGQGVAVGGEGQLVDEGRLARRPGQERRQQGVEVHRRRVRGDDRFVRGANEVGEAVAEAFAVLEPRRVGRRPAPDPVRPPLFQRPLEGLGGGAPHGAKGVAVEVELARDVEPVAVVGEGVGRVAGDGIVPVGANVGRHGSDTMEAPMKAGGYRTRSSGTEWR